MVTIAGLPLHPLVVHAVVVLLPLAALCALAVAARPRWLRRYGPLVLLVAVAGVAAVPVATQTGEQLRDALPGPNPLILVHEERAEMLLPFAVAFLVLVAAAVLAGRRADRDEAAAGTTTVRRVAVGAAALAAVAGLVVTGLVVWIGHSGSAAVWQGVGG